MMAEHRHVVVAYRDLVTFHDPYPLHLCSCCHPPVDQLEYLAVGHHRTFLPRRSVPPGSSSKIQNVTAVLLVEAYGQKITQSFNPCDEATKVDQLCPVPAGRFMAKGSQKIPSKFAEKIPSIAFAIPDLQAHATMLLKSNDGGQTLACISSTVGNGKSLEAPAVSYAAAGVVGAALVLSGAAALVAGGHPGAATSSPTFGEVVGWFHSMATNGMLSVNYPPIYRSFTKNFAFSTGLIPWKQMQMSIDDFRNKTGGNLTNDNVQFLENATLIFDEGSGTSSNVKRSWNSIFNSAGIAVREISTSINETSTAGGTEDEGGINHVVKGIQAYVEMLSVPKSNTFHDSAVDICYRRCGHCCWYIALQGYS
ncbi:conserved hypothetical protein [Histoplasma mississippiense (nom. inval.)]|uniref:conserved hypothetical protein n=1 Tax=Ajellomyces capsulatus (strain NAm1 / WU24) TaxID=2059318 RepID=UPI000157C0B2|nr:conserved hypothetical protein [Histoplasma mississippiense (nom. inval.)]EDN07108.1 conserved hypothetical protein [Histoplasma mississippiense (nom. inval.)]